MPTYHYKAMDASGQNTSGHIEAESLEAAGTLLFEREMIPTDITLQKGTDSGEGMKTLLLRLTPVKASELILFTKQFKTMVKAGVSMMRLMDIIEQQTENSRIKAVIRAMAGDVKAGASLVEAFGKHPDIFSPLFISMIRAGESSGALTEVLDRLTYIISHEEKIRSDIKAALFYPAFVLTFLAGAFLFLVTFVIPKFVAIFAKSSLELPLPTQICLALYQLLSQNWYLILPLTLVTIGGIFYYLRTEQGQYLKSTLAMRLPILGPLFIKSAMARFASIFAILQSSGIGILESMDILSFTINNAVISRQFSTIREKLQEGHGLSGPLQASRYFTPMIINMVAIGEESGNLDEMLREAADHYDNEVEYAVSRLSEAVGPLLTVGIAFVVGFFAISIFLPMWDLIQTVK